MSTDYGIGAGLIAASNMLQQISRGTGRTTHMLDTVKAGDTIVVPSDRVGDYIERALAEQLGLTRKEVRRDFDIISCRPSLRDLHERFHARPPTRLHFEHTWVEALYRNEIEDLMREFLSAPNKICRRPPPSIYEQFAA